MDKDAIIDELIRLRNCWNDMSKADYKLNWAYGEAADDIDDIIEKAADQK